MSVTCPAGHTSSATDYCDVCGVPIGPPDPGASASAAESASATAEERVCPNCDFANLAGALFCENCGYDFTTGALPEPAPAPPGGGGEAAASRGPMPAPSPAPTPSPTPTAEGAEAAEGAAPGAGEGSGPASAAAGPTGPDSPDGAAVPDPVSGPAASSGALAVPPTGGEHTWVAEIWVDPEWYADQRADDPLPSPGPPATVVLRQRTVLVGRPSASRGIVPQIDCGSDPGVSRRHCQLNTDGVRWWVEDLQSSNGTFVATSGGELPTTPIPPGQRHEVGEGGRIFIGAWTRLVLRRAVPGEA